MKPFFFALLLFISLPVQAIVDTQRLQFCARFFDKAETLLQLPGLELLTTDYALNLKLIDQKPMLPPGFFERGMIQNTLQGFRAPRQIVDLRKSYRSLAATHFEDVNRRKAFAWFLQQFLEMRRIEVKPYETATTGDLKDRHFVEVLAPNKGFEEELKAPSDHWFVRLAQFLHDTPQPHLQPFKLFLEAAPAEVEAFLRVAPPYFLAMHPRELSRSGANHVVEHELFHYFNLRGHEVSGEWLEVWPMVDIVAPQIKMPLNRPLTLPEEYLQRMGLYRAEETGNHLHGAFALYASLEGGDKDRVYGKAGVSAKEVRLSARKWAQGALEFAEYSHKVFSHAEEIFRANPQHPVIEENGVFLIEFTPYQPSLRIRPPHRIRTARSEGLSELHKASYWTKQYREYLLANPTLYRAR